MTAEEFEKKVGRPPEHDDLERVNCQKAGETGHLQCGWCRKHDKPRFACGCIFRMLHYLGNFEGLVEPRIIAGPFTGEIPDEVIIKTLQGIDEEDLLFGLTMEFEGNDDTGVGVNPRTWPFTNTTMDRLREKAGLIEKEGS